MSPDQVKAEWLPAGFELPALHETLPSQHVFVFRRAGDQLAGVLGQSTRFVSRHGR